MATLQFIFYLGLNFVIFGFIWGIFKLLISTLTGGVQQSEKIGLILHIIKYALLVAVTANFVNSMHETEVLIHSLTARIVIGSIVLGLYLLGKLQKQSKFSQLSALGGNFMKSLTTSFEPKTERLLIVGSIFFFISCLLFPPLADNALINWFSRSIKGLSNAFFIGFIFNVIAIFSIIAIFMRGSNILGKLISGQSLNESLKKDQKQNPFGKFNQFGGFANQQKQSTTEADYTKKSTMNTDSEGFTEYEDVTDN